MDKYFDMIPEEPVNREKCEQRQEIFFNYSYNNQTGTIPCDRVKLDGGDVKMYKAQHVYMLPEKVEEHRVYTNLQNYANKAKTRPISSQQPKTPIMAQRFYMREDLLNKNILDKKRTIKMRQTQQASKNRLQGGVKLTTSDTNQTIDSGLPKQPTFRTPLTGKSKQLTQDMRTTLQIKDQPNLL